MTTETTLTLPQLGKDIPATVNAALADPNAVWTRLEEYRVVEQRQGHVPYKMSILRYALSGYLTAEIGEIERFNLDISVDDEGVIVSGEPKPDAKTTGPFEIRVSYPEWLSSFFEDEANFQLLSPKSTVPLEEALLTLGVHLDTLNGDLPDEDDEEEWDEDEEEDETVIPDEILLPEEQEDEDEEDEEPEDDEDDGLRIEP